MPFTFKGFIKNDYRPELGTNITIKKLEKEKIILQATKEFEFNKKQDSNKLSFTITPSSGGTENSSSLKVEVKNGKENITTFPTHWELQIIGSLKSSPTEINMLFTRKQD